MRISVAPRPAAGVESVFHSTNLYLCVSPREAHWNPGRAVLEQNW